MNNQKEIEKRVKEVRAFAKKNAGLLGFDVESYVEKALAQLGINEE